MNKRVRSFKLLPVWAAISAVIVIAGIVLMAVLGFNTSADRPQSKTLDVSYDVSINVDEGYKAAIEEICESTFALNGIRYDEKKTLEEQTTPSGTSQGNINPTSAGWLLRYTFSADVSDEALSGAAETIAALIEGTNFPEEAYIEVTWHTLENQPFGEALWRGAVGIALGAVVALAYIAVRFGVGSALTGLAVCAHDVLFTLSLFAITRIPVYAYAPLLFAAIAAVVSVGLWLVRCMKLRENAKDPALSGLSAEEAVGSACSSTDGVVLIAGGVIAVVLAVAAACMPYGAAILFAAALLPVAVSMYSSMLLGPALHVPVRAAFDRLKAKKARYAGKQKSAKPDRSAE